MLTEQLDEISKCVESWLFADIARRGVSLVSRQCLYIIEMYSFGIKSRVARLSSCASKSCADCVMEKIVKN